jgi:hypothetical protein
MVSYRLFQIDFDPELGRHIRRLVGEYTDEWTAIAELRARRQEAVGGSRRYEVHPHELEVRHFPRSRGPRGRASAGPARPADSPSDGSPSEAEGGELQNPHVSSDGS